MIRKGSRGCEQPYLRFHHLFALDDLEWGKTDLVKHAIKLQNYTPFKEWYRCIPPHQYDEVLNISRKCWMLVQLGRRMGH